MEGGDREGVAGPPRWSCSVCTGSGTGRVGPTLGLGYVSQCGLLCSVSLNFPEDSRSQNCFPSVSRGRSSSPETHLDVTRAGCCSTLGNPPSSSACWEEQCLWEKAPRGGLPQGWLSARPWGSPPWSQHSGRSPSAWRLEAGPALPLQAPAGKTPTPHPAAWDRRAWQWAAPTLGSASRQ